MDYNILWKVPSLSLMDDILNCIETDRELLKYLDDIQTNVMNE